MIPRRWAHIEPGEYAVVHQWMKEKPGQGGDAMREWEDRIASFLGVSGAAAVNSGRQGLRIVLERLGITSGDEMIVPAYTLGEMLPFVQSLGVKLVPADIDPETFNITPESVAARITEKTKAILALHIFGTPCDIEGIMALAAQRGLLVIEDCAHALGATVNGRPVGSFGDAAAFSFCQDKIITTGGEGGMVVTNKKEIWSSVWSYKDHGKSYNAVYKSDIKPGPSFRWLHEFFGTNWRMTEMQAAIGRIQLRKLKSWVEKRRHNAEILTQAFINIPAFRVTMPPEDVYHAFYKYYVFLRPEMLKAGWDRERVIVAINELGIPCFTGSCSEMYLEKAFHCNCP